MPCENIQPQLNLEGEAEASPVQPKNVQPGPMVNLAVARKERWPEYRAWDAMKQRCGNPKAQGFHNYGGRGIAVCDQWKEFKHFFLDMGPRPSNAHSLERKDNNRGYSKENCEWALCAKQVRNKRNNRIIDFNGKPMILLDVAKQLGLHPSTLSHRLEVFAGDMGKVLTPHKLRPLDLGEATNAQILKDLRGGMSERKIAALHGVSRPVIRRIAGRKP